MVKACEKRKVNTGANKSAVEERLINNSKFNFVSQVRIDENDIGMIYIGISSKEGNYFFPAHYYDIPWIENIFTNTIAVNNDDLNYLLEEASKK